MKHKGIAVVTGAANGIGRHMHNGLLLMVLILPLPMLLRQRQLRSLLKLKDESSFLQICPKQIAGRLNK
ncbi:MAG: hypothetical protein WC756_05805 [Taibaiella sp.]|jgi:hypothetical protein